MLVLLVPIHTIANGLQMKWQSSSYYFKFGFKIGYQRQRRGAGGEWAREVSTLKKKKPWKLKLIKKIHIVKLQ